MALDFRRSFDDAVRAGVAKGARDEVLLAQRRWPCRFQGDVDDLMNELRAEELDVGGFHAHVHLLIGFPGAEIGERAQRLQLAQKVADALNAFPRFFVIVA